MMPSGVSGEKANVTIGTGLVTAGPVSLLDLVCHGWSSPGTPSGDIPHTPKKKTALTACAGRFVFSGECSFISGLKC